MAKVTKQKEEKVEAPKEEEKQEEPEKIEPIVSPIEPPIEKQGSVIEIKPEEVQLPHKDSGLSMEEKILKFLDGKTGNVRLNEFLKSLFGIPKHNEPPQWAMQSASRSIRAILNKMQSEGKVKFLNSNHLDLGSFHYPDSSTMVTHYHNLNTVEITAVK